MVNHAAGISIVTFVVAVAVSMGYYQFVYVPQANAKPILPDEILNPPQTVQVRIVEGSSQQAQTNNFVPKEVRASLGTSNKVVWTNNDSTYHTVTTDDGFEDRINGVFDSNVQLGTLIKPGGTFEFTFTAEGEYAYHCTPHPWMKGKVIVVPSFA